MRLYLSSQRLGTAPDALLALMRDTTRIGVVANAADDIDVGKRAGRVERELADLAAIGLEPAEVDLRHYFDEPDRLRSDLEAFDALWALGGNVIALRTAFRASGADVAITRRLQNDSLVYAGYSAGACILGPRDALAVASYDGRLPGYPEDSISTGMGLLPFAIVPHYGRQPGSAGATGVSDHYIDHHMPFIALRDGQAIVVDGENMRVVE
jgi:dipeptidase E